MQSEIEEIKKERDNETKYLDKLRHDLEELKDTQVQFEKKIEEIKGSKT